MQGIEQSRIKWLIWGRPNRLPRRAWRATLDGGERCNPNFSKLLLGQKEKILMKTLQSDPMQPKKLPVKLVSAALSWKCSDGNSSCGRKSKTSDQMQRQTPAPFSSSLIQSTTEKEIRQKYFKNISCTRRLSLRVSIRLHFS